MPTYEYRCKDCDHQFDIQQSFTDDAITTCPACAGTLKKVFGNVGITFKGSGFYKTDSRSGASASSSDKGSSDKGSSDKGSSDKGSSDTGSSSSSSDTGSSSSSPAKTSESAGSSSSTPATTAS